MIAGAHFFSWIESQLLLSRGATRRTLAYGNASFAKRRWTRPKELGPCELLALSSFIRLSSDLSDHDVFSPLSLQLFLSTPSFCSLVIELSGKIPSFL